MKDDRHDGTRNLLSRFGSTELICNEVAERIAYERKATANSKAIDYEVRFTTTAISVDVGWLSPPCAQVSNKLHRSEICGKVDVVADELAKSVCWLL